MTETYANVGEMQNSGIEFMIKAVPVKTDDFQYTTTLTASHNTNKVLSLSNDLYETVDYSNTGYAGDPISLPTQRVEVGSSFGKYWTLKTTGLSENGLWMVENPETGKYEEWNAAMSQRHSTVNGWVRPYPRSTWAGTTRSGGRIST